MNVENIIKKSPIKMNVEQSNSFRALLYSLAKNRPILLYNLVQSGEIYNNIKGENINVRY